MLFLNQVIEFIFGSALFINSLLFIPQAIKIYKEKKAKDVSLLTFLGFLLIQLAIVLHGIINQDYLLVIGYLLSMVTCGTVVSLVLIYNNRSAENNDIDFEEIIKQLPGHIYWKTRQGVCLGSNTNNWQDFGLKSLTDFISKTDYDLFPKDEADRLRINDEEVMRKDALIITEEKLTVSSNKRILYLSHKVPFKNKHGHIIGVLGVSVDITNAKKESEERLEMLEGIIAMMPGNVYWMNKEGVYLGCNDNQAKAIGLRSRKDIIGKKNVDMPGFLIAEILDPINERVMSTGDVIVTEEPASLQDGTKAIFLSNKSPLRNREGDIVGMVGISIDITAARRKTEQELSDTRHKLEGMTLVSASIAHETRTPLQSLDAAVGSLKKYFPTLLAAYEVAEKNNLLTHKLKPSTINLLKNIMDSMQREVQLASLVVNLLQENLVLEHAVARAENLSTEIFSVAKCINDALERYPFKMGQIERIHWQPGIDFTVQGKELLLTHILFNFLKNALHHIAVAEIKMAGKKGEIFIWLDIGNTYNTLYFKDTGTGIEADKVPYVFERFFTQTKHGAGIGLSYCKAAMEKMGGKIACDSVYGDYTLFSLSFPANHK